MILLGQVFGELTVIEDLGRLPRSHRKFKCKCSCGNVVVKYETNLLYGRSKDCHNCRWYERYPKVYFTWQSMLQRCNNPTNHAYASYGGRGITVCKEWLKFKTFLDDMGIPERDDLSLDRIDNNQGYFKSNCRWATKREQAINRRVKTLRPVNVLSNLSKRAIAESNKQAELNWLKLKGEI